MCLCGVRFASTKKATVCIVFSEYRKKKGRRDGQESGIVVRGGRVTLWWAVEALIAESVFELLEW